MEPRLAGRRGFGGGVGVVSFVVGRRGRRSGGRVNLRHLKPQQMRHRLRIEAPKDSNVIGDDLASLQQAAPLPPAPLLLQEERGSSRASSARSRTPFGRDRSPDVRLQAVEGGLDRGPGGGLFFDDLFLVVGVGISSLSPSPTAAAPAAAAAASQSSEQANNLRISLSLLPQQVELSLLIDPTGIRFLEGLFEL